MKKLLLIALLMLVPVITAAACTETPYMADSTVGYIRFDFYTGGATFCEKAIVTICRDLKEQSALTPNEDGQYVLENTLVVDTPMADVGIATRIGTLSFTSVSIAPLSSVEIPGGDEPAPEKPTFPGNAGNFSICPDNVRTWVGDQYTDLCTREATST